MIALTSPLAAAADGGTVSVAFSVLEPTVCNKLVALCTVHMVEGIAGIPAS